MAKRVLVTGISGFLASEILPRLSDEGYELVGIDTRVVEGFPYKVIQGDITKYAELETLPEADYVLHLAAIAAPAQCRANPALAYAVNVLGTNNILQWAATHKAKKFVFLSTAHVYGISPRFMPTPEDAPLLLNNDVYTISKILGEKLCRLYYDNYHLPYLAFRLYNSYGPAQTTGYFIADKIDQAKRGGVIMKGPEVTKDFVYIDDVVDAISKGLKTDFVGELNIGTGVQTSLGSIAKKIAEEFNVPYSETEIHDRPNYMQADITRIGHILDWAPKVTVEEGLAKTIKSHKT